MGFNRVQVDFVRCFFDFPWDLLGSHGLSDYDLEYHQVISVYILDWMVHSFTEKKSGNQRGSPDASCFFWFPATMFRKKKTIHTHAPFLWAWFISVSWVPSMKSIGFSYISINILCRTYKCQTIIYICIYIYSNNDKSNTNSNNNNNNLIYYFSRQCNTLNYCVYIYIYT